MEILKVENISKIYGNKTLFENISFVINEKERIALTAKNGNGKTTLLNIITGEDIPDEGKINLNSNIKLSYLKQYAEADENKTVIDFVLDSENEAAVAVKEYEKALLSGNAYLIQKTYDEIERLDAGNFENEVKTVLSKLKLTDFNASVKILSGGQKKRLELASALLKKPDFLILDEPTNHLDFEMTDWLEKYILKSGLTLLLVTHDRYFLDNVCNTVFEIDEARLFTYKGNYSYFLKKRNERKEILKAETEKAENLLRTETKWMNRQPRARTSKAKYRTDNFYKLKEKAERKIGEETFEIKTKGQRLGKKIIDIYDISKSYGDKVLIKDFSHKFVKGEKIAIIGANGAGKSTLLNIICGKINPDKGRIEIGETVRTGFFEQKSIDIKEDIRLIDYLKNIAETVTTGKNNEITTAQFAESFLFPRKMHGNYISRLSGGERKRLYLTGILMKNPNFIMLDEPTNDLDLSVSEILADYLLKFDGTVLFVSHDRYFIDKVADYMFVFEKGGKITKFPGNYSDYVKYKKTDKLFEQKEKKSKSDKKKPKSDKKKLSYKEKREMEQLEKELEALNNEKNEIEKYLQGGVYEEKELAEKSKRLPELNEIIDEKEMRWLELSEKS